MEAVRPQQGLCVCISHLEGWEYFYVVLAWRYEIIGLFKKTQKTCAQREGTEVAKEGKERGLKSGVSGERRDGEELQNLGELPGSQLERGSADQAQKDSFC